MTVALGIEIDVAKPMGAEKFGGSGSAATAAGPGESGAKNIHAIWQELLASLGVQAADSREATPGAGSPEAREEMGAMQKAAESQAGIAPSDAASVSAADSMTMQPGTNPAGISARLARVNFTLATAPRLSAEFGTETQPVVIGTIRRAAYCAASSKDSREDATKKGGSTKPATGNAMRATNTAANVPVPVSAPVNIPGPVSRSEISRKTIVSKALTIEGQANTAEPNARQQADKESTKESRFAEQSGPTVGSHTAETASTLAGSDERAKLAGAAASQGALAQNEAQLPVQNPSSPDTRNRGAQTSLTAAQAAQAAAIASASPTAADASPATPKATAGASHAASASAMQIARLTEGMPAGREKRAGAEPAGGLSVETSALSRDPSGLRIAADAVVDHPASSAGRSASSSEGETFAALDAGSSLGTPTWVHSTAQHAEAGFNDPSLGWVGVRADMSAGGIHAAVVPGSTDAAQALSGHMAGLSAHLAAQHTTVDSVTVSTPQAGDGLNAGQGSQQGAYQGSQGNPGQDTGQAGASMQPEQAPGAISARSPAASARLAGVASSGAVALRGGKYISVLA
jgi:Flagellar hook-length control protein FliK